jgi:hypothetical protein
MADSGGDSSCRIAREEDQFCQIKSNGISAECIVMVFFYIFGKLTTKVLLKIKDSCQIA